MALIVSLHNKVTSSVLKSRTAYLSGALVAEAVTGLQKSVISAVKHFVGNEQETNRRSSGSVGAAGVTPAVSSNIDDRTFHEMYTWAFQDAVRAGAACVMCSYQRLNGTQACENDQAINGVLKTQLGFPGFVLTDWAASASPSSPKAGLDMYMPFPG
jgi:beta-glucosidase